MKEEEEEEEEQREQEGRAGIRRKRKKRKKNNSKNKKKEEEGRRRRRRRRTTTTTTTRTRRSIRKVSPVPWLPQAYVVPIVGSVCASHASCFEEPLSIYNKKNKNLIFQRNSAAAWVGKRNTKSWYETSLTVKLPPYKKIPKLTFRAIRLHFDETFGTKMLPVI